MADTPIISTSGPDDGIPAPAPGEPAERNRQMGTALARAIEEGKDEVPDSPHPLVCKPQQIESWRVFRIMAEFVDGFDLLKKYGLTATFFGSVRGTVGDRYYEQATELAGRLAGAGYTVITGGSAGIMEAANKGAHEAGGNSVGLNIRLGDVQAYNGYLTDSFTFDHFFVRKVMLAFASEVYIYFPGGFGTLDEFTEIVTLVQTKKIKPVPIVCYGRDFWDPLVAVFKDHLLGKYGSIDEADLDLFVVVDTVDEAFAYIQKKVTSC
jgi:hypothetical protein